MTLKVEEITSNKFKLFLIKTSGLGELVSWLHGQLTNSEEAAAQKVSDAEAAAAERIEALISAQRTETAQLNSFLVEANDEYRKGREMYEALVLKVEEQGWQLMACLRVLIDNGLLNPMDTSEIVMIRNEGDFAKWVKRKNDNLPPDTKRIFELLQSIKSSEGTKEG